MSVEGGKFEFGFCCESPVFSGKGELVTGAEAKDGSFIWLGMIRVDRTLLLT